MLYATVENNKLYIKEFDPSNWYSTYTKCLHNVNRNLFALLCEEDLCGVDLVYSNFFVKVYNCIGPYYTYKLIVGRFGSLPKFKIIEYTKLYRGCVYETNI